VLEGDEVEKMATFEPSAGTCIDKACADAVALASQANDAVRFSFNGIALQALPADDPQVIVNRWRAILEEQQRAYRESPEGRQAKAARDREIVKRQSDVNACIEALPKILRTDNHLNALMKWLQEFIPAADDVAVVWDRQTVAITLEDGGYKENEHVGQQPEWFNTRERMGRYIAGQVISGIREVGCAHPIALKFIDSYFALPAKGTEAEGEEG